MNDFVSKAIYQDSPFFNEPPHFFFDMETGDPDDVYALALLATHPWSRLAGVTVHPGGRDQVGLVKEVLRILRVDVPVGAGTPKSDKPRVSGFHEKILGKIQPRDPDGTTVEVIHAACRKHPRLHLVTGAALTNIAAAARTYPDPDTFFGGGWTCQGGFVGADCLDSQDVLPKFAGMNTCPTYNLGGDAKAAQYLLCPESPLWCRTRMVGKNVCHGITWDRALQDRIPSRQHPGLELIRFGMDSYLRDHPGGKALHDVVAAVLALHHYAGTWISVLPYRDERGNWGCRQPEFPRDVEKRSDLFVPQALIRLNADIWPLKLYQR